MQSFASRDCLTRDRMGGTPRPSLMIELALQPLVDTDSNFQSPQSIGWYDKLHPDRERPIVDFELRFGATDDTAQMHLSPIAGKRYVPGSFS